MAKKLRIAWIPCSNCGGGAKKHVVQKELVKLFGDEYGPTRSEAYQICECAGCQSIRFRIATSPVGSRDPDTDEAEELDEKIFPEFRSGARNCLDAVSFPKKIQQIYRETVAAFNARINTLAGGGIRAIVEGICKDQKASGKNLLMRIDELVNRNLLARPQADFLHEARYIGNEALHELQQPSEQAIHDGLDIVENLLNTIYVLPIKANRLKAGRTAKKRPKKFPARIRLRLGSK